ncbi:MAG: EAL domain-containing protein [Henriciella sp.]|nr:EAL domain-containing protein [Henriciella sp.]
MDKLQDTVESNGFSMDRIELEITEHVAFRNLDDNIATLTRARDLGCKIVLDDFGSGYSSLSLLEELPLDKVKLDKSLQSSNQQRGVLAATIRLARDLGFLCCVEGIESEAAAQFATEKGCRQMQGFWFGHPETVGAVLAQLKIAS